MEYKVYSQDGKELNLLLCKNIDVDIHYPVKENNIDFNTIDEIKEKGYDILNASSDFYNDYCTIFSFKGDDIVLPDRKKLFATYNVCESNCTYNGFDFNTKKSFCKCKLKHLVNITRVIISFL